MLHKAKVTIDDVARKVGVSRQTVSRVINNGPNVKPQVRDRIEAAIAELGYVPNLSARRMGGGRSYMILAINDRARTIENWRAGRGNDWVGQMLYGGMTECEARGYHMVFELVDTDAEKAPRQLDHVVASLRPDGVILTPPHSDNDALAELLAARGIACARIGRATGSATVDVYMDEARAAAEVTQFLAGLGHRRIAFIAGSPEYGSSRLRIEGFRAAAQAAGLAADDVHVGNGLFRFDSASQQIDALLALPRRPTAIIADNDEMAFAAMHVAARNRLDVPRDLSIICFEDTPGVRFSVPPLTAIRQPTAAMVARACAQLVAISTGEPGVGNFELPYALVQRATTAPPPED